MPRPKKTPSKAARAAKTQPTPEVEASKPTINEKLNKMTQIDGVDQARQSHIQVSQKKSLDEIWGRKFSKFKTNDLGEYNARLRSMTKLDLQQECIKMGLMPHDNRDTMIERLSKECRKYLAAAQTSNLQPIPIKLSNASRHILARSGNSMI